MKTIVEIEWNKQNFTNTHLVNTDTIKQACDEYFSGLTFTVRELPVQPEQGPGERECATCKLDVTCDAPNKPNADCMDWQPIPGKVDDKNVCAECQRPFCNKVCNKFEFNKSEDIGDGRVWCCVKCNHAFTCHEQGEG